MADDPFDLAALRLAVALADAGDLARAGAALGVGRRTVSARIAQLERAAGALLFDHSGKAVRLTRAGEAFIAEARLVLAALGRAGRLAREVADQPEAVALGATAEALFGPLRDLLQEPAWAEAGLSPLVQVMPAAAQAAALAEGRIVLGFLAPPVPVLARLEHRTVAASPWSAVVPEAEARLRRTASLAALARKPLVMLARERAPLAVDGLIAALGATGAKPSVAQEAPDWPAAVAMVALGLGSALVPSIVARRLTVEGAAVLPLAEAADLPPFPLSAVWLPQPPGSRAARAVAIVRAMVRSPAA